MVGFDRVDTIENQMGFMFKVVVFLRLGLVLFSLEKGGSMEEMFSL
jgi:hypothetical protein